MSKLYNTYLKLKSKNDDANTLYLFKSGIFFIFLDEDAKIASKIFDLKLTHFTETVLKCGFPINSLEKYQKLFSLTQYSVVIIENYQNATYSGKSHSIINNTQKILDKIEKIDLENTSIKELYQFVEELKNDTKKIQNNF